MISLVVQAGGRSSRMGRDKGLVLLQGKPMIEHVLGAVSALADEVVVTTNAPAGYEYLGYPLVGDEEPGAGALPGLRTALRAATGDLLIVVACDMPFLNVGLIRHQVALAATADVVVPRWEDRLQTMHAVYRREPVLAAVENALTAGKKRMISFYDELQVRIVEPDDMAEFGDVGRSFFNVNTPEELVIAESM